jgi:hypothetical protein
MPWKRLCDTRLPSAVLDAAIALYDARRRDSGNHTPCDNPQVTLFDPDPYGSRPYTNTSSRGRSRASLFGIVLAGVSAVGLFLTLAPSNPLSVVDPYTMPTEIEEIARDIGFTDEGESIFIEARPQLLDSGEFLQSCVDSEHGTEGGELSTVGCYFGVDNVGGQIAIFRPTDDRLASQQVTTAAHEFLHAAYAQLSSGERAKLDPLLEQRWAMVQMSLIYSVGSHGENRATEQFAYLGTTVTESFTAELEAVYARYFLNRSDVVAAYTDDLAMWDAVEAEYQAAATAVQVLEQENATEVAQLQADIAQLDADRASYSDLVTSYNARPAEERSRLYVLESDGSFGEPYGDYLEGRADSLASRDADIVSRQGLLSTSEAEAVAARANVDVLGAGYDALAASAVPFAG